MNELKFLIESEESNISQFEKYLGKSRNGFCDFGTTAIFILFEAQKYCKNSDVEFDENDEFINFEDCFRSTFYYILHRVSFTFKATYDLTTKGYYTESLTLLRSLFENVISLKYVEKRKNVNLTTSLLAGKKGFKGNKFNITKKDMCDDISPELYNFYKYLCEFTHVSLAANLPNIEINNGKIESAFLSTRFDTKMVGIVVNQLCIYLLYFIKNMTIIFPEIKENSVVSDKIIVTLDKLEECVEQMEDDNFGEYKKILCLAEK